MPVKYTKEQYAKLFKEWYPKYELLSDYEGNMAPIQVRCKVDGHIWATTPKRLKAGQGCQVCYDRRRGDATRVGKEAFIKKAKQIHGDKYDYSKVVYKNNKIPVTLICPKHGEFHVRPDKHISRKDGCPDCANEQNGLKKRLPQEEFIRRARNVHGDKYDYSKVDYQGYKQPVIIICPKHGEFPQSPYLHMTGCGCPICRQSHMENETMNFLKSHNIKFERQKRFEWLGNKTLDFFLPDYNIGIECQGLQHFRPIYGTKNAEEKKENFVKIFRRDLAKKKECDENGIKLYYMIHSKSQKLEGNLCDIYNEENTFYSVDEILQLINKTTLFEEIVRKTLDSTL